MADDELEMTWDEKILHAAIAVVVPIVVVGVAIEFVGRPEAAVRYAGGIVELFGLALSAAALREKVLRVTGRRGLLDRAGGWIDRASQRVKRVVTGEPDDTALTPDPIKMGHTIGEPRITEHPGPDASLDNRVEILEKGLESVRSRLDDVESDAREVRDELQTEIDDVRSDLHAVEDDLGTLVRRLAVGSFHWEATGFGWIAAGVVLATWPGAIPGV